MAVKLVPLTKGKFAQVDEQDFADVSQWKWYAFESKGSFYAARKAGMVDTDYRYREVIFMHKYLLNTSSIVDHKDNDGLNNRRGNLRSASYRQNNSNRSSRSVSSSQYLGVYWDKARQLWVAKCDGVFQGRFASEEAAAKAYDKFAIEQFGEFANLNFKS